MKARFMELVKMVLVKKHGTDSCKELADMPTNELTFAVLRENIEHIYSKYKDDLTKEQYNQLVEEVFQIHKEYKLSLDKAEEKEYGKIYGDCAEKILETIHKYGIKVK